MSSGESNPLLPIERPSEEQEDCSAVAIWREWVGAALEARALHMTVIFLVRSIHVPPLLGLTLMTFSDRR